MITRETVQDKIIETEAKIKVLKEERRLMPDDCSDDVTLRIQDLERKKANLLRLQV